MLVIAIESIIGAGKSTLLYDCLLPILSKRGWRVTIVDEPVSKWNKSGLLEKFYEDPKRWAYHFQTKAFHDRVKECQKQFENHAETTEVFLLERSVFSDTIFMKTLLEQGVITDFEYSDYLDWWSLWEKVVPFQPDIFIYLKPDLEVCMKRVQERARDGECNISIDYQRILQKKHDEFFGKFVEIAPKHFVPVYHLCTNANFRDFPEVKLWISDLIEEKIKSLQQVKRC
jgi:deoxyadenosine/deoxycytidine kinase